MRITSVRILVQIFFFSLFLFFCFITEFSYLKGYPVSLFLEADPLVGIATAISTHTVYRGLLWSLVLILPTLMLGRIFCNWICPYGILHQFTGWLFNTRNVQQKVDSNRYRSIYKTKYFILIFCIVTAALGSLQIGLLDPICLMFRSFTAAILPAINMPTGAVYTQVKEHYGAWLIGMLLFGLVAMNLVIPRFFCRVLCPLGALLGTLSRFAIWRIDRDPKKCTDCDLCLQHCEGASDPHTMLRKSECFVCFNCIEDCPHDALSFKLLPREESGITKPDVSRRHAAFAAIAAAFFYPFSRLSNQTNNKTFDRSVIRPPGSVEESEFLERCIKCDQCIRVCPTNVLQPAFFQAGLEGLWTPVMDMRSGHCELNCTLCGQVCPTGAIQKISIEEKLGLGRFVDQGPVKVGTAFYDRGRCLPWAMETACVVCEEVCPVSPKAIETYDEVITRWDGTKVTLNKPFIIPERCIGCGICERECPVLDERAVYVTAVGETRFHNQSDRRLLLNDKQKAEVKMPGNGKAQARSISLSAMILAPQTETKKSGGCGSSSSGGSGGGCGSCSCSKPSSPQPVQRAPKALSTDENFDLVAWVRRLNKN
jgi:polyferredoxin